jgi:hypothetical protein
MTELCATHPREPARGRCSTCGRPYCDRCRVEEPATERAFCSETCRVVTRFAHRPASGDRFVAALHRPVRTGWRLAAEQAGPITLWVGIPIGLVYGVLRSFTLGDRWNETVSLSGGHEIGSLLCMALGAGAIGVILSDAYRGAPPTNPWPHVAARFLPWGVVWLCFAVAVLLGTLLLIVPGVIAAARLFWADEFALIHGHGPSSAIRESMQLTRGLTGRIFGFQFVLGMAQNLMLIPLVIGMLAISTAARSMDPGPAVTVLFSTLLSVLMAGLYASLHAPEIVYFYGLRELRGQLPENAIRGDWVGKALRGSHSPAGARRRR